MAIILAFTHQVLSKFSGAEMLVVLTYYSDGCAAGIMVGGVVAGVMVCTAAVASMVAKQVCAGIKSLLQLLR